MSTTVTAARIYEYGEPDVFRFETMDVPDPVGHEVLVRNTVIGLNFVDIYYRRGTLPVPEFPAIIGDEASGVVASAPAAFRVRVWHITSRGWDPWTERPLPEVVRVAYPLRA